MPVAVIVNASPVTAPAFILMLPALTAPLPVPVFTVLPAIVIVSTAVTDAALTAPPANSISLFVATVLAVMVPLFTVNFVAVAVTSVVVIEPLLTLTLPSALKITSPMTTLIAPSLVMLLTEAMLTLPVSDLIVEFASRLISVSLLAM